MKTLGVWLMMGLTVANAAPAAATVPPPSSIVPTQAACAALGFEVSPNAPPELVRRSTARKPPKRPSSQIVQEMVVTGSRRDVPTIPPLPVPPVEHRVESAAPPPPPPPPPPPVAQAYAPAPPAGRWPGWAETERYPSAPQNPVRQVAEQPVSTFSIDVDTASYANVRRFLNDGQRPPADAVRVEELVNYFDYGYPRPKDRSRPFAPFVAVAPSPWSPGHQILHIGLQGYALPSAERPPLNLVFLIDTSGSMYPQDRLPLARKALNVLIDQLRPQDHVAMVAYAGSAGAVLGPTDGRQKLKMRCALASLESGGATAGGAGLKLACDLARERFDPKAVNRVILMTDGDFNVGVADPAKLKDFVADQRKSGVYLSVYGFGRGNYKDVTMQALAQNGNGTAGYVDSLSEARKLFHDDFSRSLFPIADDVKVQVEFNPAMVREYRLIGYETRLLAREDFNNDQVDAGEVGSGAAVTALYEITPANAPGSVDPLRYGRKAAPAGAGKGRELAFLKVRYKLPRASASQHISRAITAADVRPTLAAAPEATRWAVAVAAYGQKLRRDPHVGDRLSWEAVEQLAQGARGADPDGLRAEFVQLVRKAADAGPLALR